MCSSWVTMINSSPVTNFVVPASLRHLAYFSATKQKVQKVLEIVKRATKFLFKSNLTFKVKILFNSQWAIYLRSKNKAIVSFHFFRQGSFSSGFWILNFCTHLYVLMCQICKHMFLIVKFLKQALQVKYKARNTKLPKEKSPTRELLELLKRFNWCQVWMFETKIAPLNVGC